jgi:hypothetical protein
MQRSLAYCPAAAGLSLLLAAAATAAPSVDTSKMSLDEYAHLPVCTLSADGQHLATEPCRTAPAKKPMPRRPVPQIVQRQPSLPVPRAVPMPPAAKLSLPPSQPTPALNCDPGGCYDLNGVRHNNAAGNSTITPAGKLCIRNGVWLQCQ